MKTYIIKNKFFSLGGASTVKDEDGNEAFKVKGKVFTLRSTKHVTDLEKNELYTVQNKMFNFIMNAAYVIDKATGTKYKVQQKFSLKSKFEISGGDNKITVEGNIFGFDYHILSDGEEIGYIHRNLTIATDSFLLECEEKDAAFLVALVIAIDNICDKNREERQNANNR